MTTRVPEGLQTGLEALYNLVSGVLQDHIKHNELGTFICKENMALLKKIPTILPNETEIVQTCEKLRRTLGEEEMDHKIRAEM